MKQSIEIQIKSFLVEHFPSARKKELGSREALLENGIVDSLGILDLVAFIEGTFAIAVADEDLIPDNFNSIEKISLFVESKRAETTRS
jgi:acyl carrier protein